MNTSMENRSRSLGEKVVLAMLWCAWHAFRLPVLALLLILAPVVRIVLSAFALLMTFTAFLFEFAGARPFPFFGALAVGLGAFGVLMVYEGLIQLLSGRRD